MKCTYWISVADYPNGSWIPLVRSMYPDCTWASGSKLEDKDVTAKYVFVLKRPGKRSIMMEGSMLEGELPFPIEYIKLQELFT